MLTGSCVALVTPFRGDAVDDEKLRELVEFHVAKGTDALVPCGTTGESPTLSHEEHHHVIEVVVKAARKRLPVIAGAGSNSTAEALSLTRHAKKVGADAVLSIVPYYNKPTQRGMIEHFRTVADAVDIPMLLYNIPGRTGVKMNPETIAECCKHRNIVGVKEACGSVEQVCDILALCDTTVLSGDDALTYPMMAVGGKGVISVAANIIPKEIKAMVQAASKGDFERARQIHYRYWRLFKDLFVETNPIPIKAAMAMMGMIEFSVRLPLCAMAESSCARLEQTMKAVGLL